MTSIVNTNMNSLTAQRNLGMNQASLATAMQRLSSGLRINSAKDDAAGLAISERMTAQVRGANQAARNANDGISLAQTAEGDLTQIGANLQRMRELSVQAANATNTASDRVLLNSEVQSLSAEIDRVSQASSFNGVKLLDGSFSAQNFQVGANSTANDTVTIASIASARTSALGGVGTSFAATATGTATTASLSAGDLTLNGFQVGASELGAAPGQSTASAYSVAAAINKIQSDSGVTATANSNAVTGGTITAFGAGAGTGAIAANTFSINGINVGAVQGGATAPGQGANVAAAINAVATQTGVTATASATTGALSLTAADGRDISIAMNGTAANPTAAADAKTVLMTQTGLSTGAVGAPSYVAAGTPAVDRLYIDTATPGVTGDWIAIEGVTFTFQQAVAYSAVVVDGTNVTLNADFASATYADTATNMFKAIQDAQLSGLTAAALATFTATNPSAGNVYLTSVAAGPSALTFATGSAFNNRFESLTPGTTGGAEVAGVAAANHGTVTLSSTSADGIVWAGAAAGKAGLAASGSQGATTTSTVSSISSMNVLTAASATSALSAIDGALSTVNASRASLGAIQNRFTSVVTSLQTTSENLTASRSRIQDADFASETANLSRAQVLQQAGTAMVAQANQLPQGVLALLR